jgi:hypothetical protein
MRWLSKKTNPCGLCTSWTSVVTSEVPQFPTTSVWLNIKNLIISSSLSNGDDHSPLSKSQCMELVFCLNNTWFLIIRIHRRLSPCQCSWGHVKRHWKTWSTIFPYNTVLLHEGLVLMEPLLDIRMSVCRLYCSSRATAVLYGSLFGKQLIFLLLIAANAPYSNWWR